MTSYQQAIVDDVIGQHKRGEDPETIAGKLFQPFVTVKHVLAHGTLPPVHTHESMQELLDECRIAGLRCRATLDRLDARKETLDALRDRA
ncbi:MAG: nucleotidyltransferase domain-containing protein [Planctomycetaceae bacterium]|nr:nucleotidyltransferase domain-containing protein [Planctomycetaceae bacterium]